MAHKATRRGFTMIEMMVFISVMSVLMLLVIGWISETMKFSARTRSHQKQHLQLTRFSQNFRSDVRMSESMSFDDDKRLILNQSNGQTVIYQISGSSIVAEKTTATQSRQERFLLASNTQIDWDATGMPDRIGVIVTRKPHPSKKAKVLPSDNDPEDNADVMPIDIHVFAQIGRWPIEYVVENSEREMP